MMMMIMMVFSMAVGPHVDDDDAKLHDVNIDYI